jgi:hypothetical protein
MGIPTHLKNAWLRHENSRLHAWLSRLEWTSLAAFGLPLMLYVLTLAPTIYNLDSAELTTAAATGGIIRATGYPLYLILGGLWSKLPLGDVGYRMNLMSAVCGAGTLLLAERILARLQVRHWARLGAVGLLATAPYFWALSLIAEVYTLHTLLMAGIILVLLAWREQPTPWRLALAVFLTAVSLGNHMATVLLAPGCVLFVLLVAKGAVLRPRNLIPAIFALLLGLSVYLYLPWRYGANPVFNYAGTYDAHGIFHSVNLQTASGLWWLVSGQSFAGQMAGYSLNELMGELFHFGEQLWQAFFGLGIGPALLGVYVLAKRDKAAAILLSLMFIANVLFYANYRVVDKDTMFLPAYLIWALWLGVGYQQMIDWFRAYQDESSSNAAPRHAVTPPTYLPWLWRGVMIAIVLAALAWNWQQVDQSQDWSTRTRSERILALVEPNAIVLGWWDTVPGVQYLQLVEGERPDVLAINRFLISGDDMTQLIRTYAADRPIYINNPPAEFLKTMHVEPVGPVYRLYPK